MKKNKKEYEKQEFLLFFNRKLHLFYRLKQISRNKEVVVNCSNRTGHYTLATCDIY